MLEPYREPYDFDNVREYEARRFKHDVQEMEGRAVPMPKCFDEIIREKAKRSEDY